LKSYESRDLNLKTVKYYFCCVLALGCVEVDASYVRDELVPFVLADQLLQAIKEVETFLIWNGAEGIIWVFAFEVDDQFCEFVIFAIHFDGVFKGFPADDCAEVAVRLAVNLGLDTPFQVSSPSFV
jgi:hypothetical protein